MSFNAIRKTKILAKNSEFTVMAALIAILKIICKTKIEFRNSNVLHPEPPESFIMHHPHCFVSNWMEENG